MSQVRCLLPAFSCRLSDLCWASPDTEEVTQAQAVPVHPSPSPSMELTLSIGLYSMYSSMDGHTLHTNTH